MQFVTQYKLTVILKLDFIYLLGWGSMQWTEDNLAESVPFFHLGKFNLETELGS